MHTPNRTRGKWSGDAMMKNPLWIVNSALIILLIGGATTLLVMRRDVPLRRSIVATAPDSSQKKDVSRIASNRITEADLFNTVVKRAPALEIVDPVKPIPRPPTPAPVVIPETPKPEFLSPLEVTVRGVIYAGNDLDNRAIIMNNKTKQETLCKIGDRLEDADIIKIGRNKVVFVRVNGQQETLFISQRDARKDPGFVTDGSWNGIVSQASESMFLVDPKRLVERMQTLAQFIDTLDITTAFSRGSIIGCRIGRLAPQSLGRALGLLPGDIITEINGVAPTTTANRVEIYTAIRTLKRSDSITTKIIRGSETIARTYILQKIPKASPEARPQLGEVVTRSEIQGATPQQSFAPEMARVQRNERKTMIQSGGRGSLIQRMQQ